MYRLKARSLTKVWSMPVISNRQPIRIWLRNASFVPLAAVCVLAVNPAVSQNARSGRAPLNTAPQASSLVRPGAVNDIPHLTEVGWDDGDLPFLLTIRFMPQKTSFAAGWSEWVLQTIFREERLLPTQQPNPWPKFFVANASRSPTGGLGLPPDELRQFQDWSNKRAETLPPVIVHAIPYLAPNPDSSQSVVRILPFGLQPGVPRDDQRVEGIGFSNMIYLGLARNADDCAVSLPPDIVARLPRSGLQLETRVRWSEPHHVDGTLLFATEPLSLRLVAGKQLFWEYSYPQAGEAASTAPGPNSAAPPDIKF